MKPMDTKDEAEPVNQARARETCHGGNTRFFTNGAVACVLPPARMLVLAQKVQGPGPMVQFQGAAILPVSRRGSLVLVLYLVLMGCLELKRRTPNYLSFSLHILPCHPRLPSKGSYRHSHRGSACLTHGPGYDPHGAAARGR